MSFEKSIGSNSGAPLPETKFQSMTHMATFEKSIASNSGAPLPETSEKKSQSMSNVAPIQHSSKNDSDPSAPPGDFRSPQVGTASEDHIVKQEQDDVRRPERSENSNSSERRPDPPSNENARPMERSKPSGVSDSVPAESQQETVDFTMSFNGKHFKEKMKQFTSERSELPSNQPGERLD